MHIKRRRLPGEFVFVLLLLAFSAFLLWNSYKISGFSSFTSAGAYPMVTTTVMLVSALVIIWQSLNTPREDREPGQSLAAQFFAVLTPAMVIKFTAAILAYMLLLEWLGFALCSYLFMVIGMYLLGSTRIVLNLVISALSLGFIHVVFQTIFSVAVPKGSLIQRFFQ
ncbi:tripartite tricarboxylate transporter TctB family protein [Azoarcus sp. L1K30]|uniref:tripartite tricarboxylate transporter TctB family protein n=1 Tax=Azoarcus sp. L1K30 TaxID=2820277 RepID=UPI001B845F59|nr:tripartite tricarboxylate transporter TctB family protein [Azoarcus sp. L1K30]MBR0564725.1 tripartite tricarboxylate transporter TctB family protein [Azoarcus sp. L1K30]